MVPNAELSITTQTTGRFASIAVATTEGLLPNAPSPINATAARFGCAIFTPSTAEGPKPIVANPLGVMKVPGTVIGKLLADAVLVPADVGDDEAVFGNRGPQLGENPFRPHGKLIRRRADAPNPRRFGGTMPAMAARRIDSWAPMPTPQSAIPARAG